MNQAITGRFIATARKKKGYTQRALAEKLNISDKTVSKWETGNGFPEISLMMPLCRALGISVNELLTGEYLSETQYKAKAEENMMTMIQEREENAKKMKMTVLTGIIAIVAFVTIFGVVDTYGEHMPRAVRVLLYVIACVLFALGIYVAAIGDRTIGYYRCKHCNEHFVPAVGAYVMGMHTITRRYLRCPKCQKTSWCKKVLSKPTEDEESTQSAEAE